MPTSDDTPATPVPRKAIIAVVIGNWLEFYDFIVFTFFAVMIGNAFFPGQSDIARLLGALATFGAGFLTRPLGAVIIGAYADRAGRKAALTLTLVLMAIGTGLVGLTPSYAQIGVAAPVILVIARLIQGFSCGGELGPATSYLLEAAPPKRRALFTAFQGHSQQLASITGSLVGFLLAVTLSKAALYDWGWRVPFLLGTLVAPIGIFIRLRLPETVEKSAKRISTANVLGELIRHHSRAVVLGILVISGSTISTYVFNYMATYAITTLKLPEATATALTLTGGLVQLAGISLGAWLDRFGRRNVFALSRTVFILILFPVYLLMTMPHAPIWSILALNMLLNFVFAIGTGVIFAILSEAFPKPVRASGLSILYALSVTIFGGTTQFVVAWLISVIGDPLVPAWYQIGANVLSIAAALILLPRVSSRVSTAAS